MENLKELLEASRQLVLEVGAYIRQESAVFDRSKTETKGSHAYRTRCVFAYWIRSLLPP